MGDVSVKNKMSVNYEHADNLFATNWLDSPKYLNARETKISMRYYLGCRALSGTSAPCPCPESPHVQNMAVWVATFDQRWNANWMRTVPRYIAEAGFFFWVNAIV